MTPYLFAPLVLLLSLFACTTPPHEVATPIYIIPNTTPSSRFLPDPVLTPGAINENVTQATINETICVSGWTDTVRPPTTYTNKMKAVSMQQYGITGNMSDYEFDHLVPLSSGGHPSDPRNLWPEPWEGEYGARIKDKLEVKLKKMICNGSVTLAEAQHMMAVNWTDSYNRYYGAPQ